MRAGYFTMPLHPPGADPGLTMAADLDQLVVLDRLGYAEAWVGEHFTAEWENIPCPDLFIAKALGMTRSIRLGTGVSCLPNHHPLMLAQRIAQLDHLARGRFLWGIGSGGFPGDFELFGIDHKAKEHLEVTRQSLEVILDLWNDPKPGLRESRYWRFRVPEPQDDIDLRLHLRPFQRPHPPIAVAGVSADSETLTLAGEHGWIPMSINFVPARVLRTHWASVEAGAGRAGRTPDRAAWRVARDVLIADTPAEARRLALTGPLARDWNGYFLPLLRKSRRLGAVKVDPAMPDDAVTVEYLLEHIWIVGSVDEVAARLRRLRDDVGGFGTLLVIGHEWDPPGVWERSMERLVGEVLPAL
jgi:alkanesulfonate monooxygenase SsuD/methylene tetrahydromethanopterin reductase-like flavin-dependent oxidoreductase (luciferase family)